MQNIIQSEKNMRSRVRQIGILFVAIMFMVATDIVSAQTPIVTPDLSIPTKIAPAYFAPNAFPVPDMLDGSTSKEWCAELYTDHYFGTIARPTDDYTTNLFARLTIPLFSSRANLTLWGNLLEYYSTAPVVNRYRRVGYDGRTTNLLAGDIYVSTDIAVLTQEHHKVDVAIRAAVKTASGDDYEFARYYDNAGYFFDATVGRHIAFGSGRTSLKIAASAGFLCWQTDNGRQNDAVMYGLRGEFDAGPFAMSAEWGGYVGWERDGDAPMTLKLDASWSIGKVAIIAGYRVGLMDWPFHQARLGASYRFNINTKSKSTKD